MHISKRAKELNELKKATASIWQDDKGPFENIFNLFGYAMPFIPGLGWFVAIANQISSVFYNSGLSDFGRYIDTTLGLGPGSDISDNHLNQAGQLFISKLAPAFASENLNKRDQFRKEAFFGSLLKLLGNGQAMAGLLPKIIKILKSVILWILMVNGAQTISELYSKNKPQDKEIEDQEINPQSSEQELNAMSNWEKSEVLGEFFKIAMDQGMIKVAKPEKNPRQESEQTIKEKRLKPSEKSIVDEAHPKPAYIAESRGDGGLVENLWEQHEALMRVINKMPTGSLVGSYASATLSLVKLANELDDVGETNMANLLTEIANQLTEELHKMTNKTNSLNDLADSAQQATSDLISECEEIKFPLLAAPTKK